MAVVGRTRAELERRRPHLPVVVALALVSCEARSTPAGGRAGPSRKLPLSSCLLTAPGSVERMSARCGRLSVLEDRAKPDGRRIELEVAVVPALVTTPERDALLFLAGGPGEAATEAFLKLAPAFSRVNERRDVVLVDQRGTGRSNPLRCAQKKDEDLSLLSDEALEEELAACLERLEGADPRAYTTAAFVEDLEEVREALGYEQLDIYGVSYGTRAALAFLSRHAERVRTMILDGVVPPDVPLGLGVEVSGKRALEAQLSRCEADPGCRAAFPSVRDELAAIFRRLEAGPIEVWAEHPKTGERTLSKMSTQRLERTLRLFIYSSELAALLPLLVHDASVRSDLGRIAAQSLLLSDQLDRSIAGGLNLSVLCTETLPAVPEGEGGFEIRELRRACAHWPRGQAPAWLSEPVRASVPALLLSGELDPVTPPSGAERVAAGLSDSVKVVAGGQGHVVITRGCIHQLVADLIESGSTKDLDASCAGKIRPMPFFLRFSGPDP